ncbi:MAG: hypothetical protein J5699_05940, partial [Bacteroidales bacterium]|nr:hypothetical protein [Bacteroidales bacterium]
TAGKYNYFSLYSFPFLYIESKAGIINANEIGRTTRISELFTKIIDNGIRSTHNTIHAIITPLSL